MKHFSNNSTLCYLVGLVKRFFYFFLPKKPRSGVAGDSGRKKIISFGNMRRSRNEYELKASENVATKIALYAR